MFCYMKQIQKYVTIFSLVCLLKLKKKNYSFKDLKVEGRNPKGM